MVVPGIHAGETVSDDLGRQESSSLAVDGEPAVGLGSRAVVGGGKLVDNFVASAIVEGSLVSVVAGPFVARQGKVLHCDGRMCTVNLGKDTFLLQRAHLRLL